MVNADSEMYSEVNGARAVVRGPLLAVNKALCQDIAEVACEYLSLSFSQAPADY